MEIDISDTNVNKSFDTQQCPTSIPIINKDICYDTFFETYLLPNHPCIIRNVAAHWKATKYWLNETKTKVNFKYLYEKYAKAEVLVYNCNVKYYNSHKTKKMAFPKYLIYWEAYKESGYSDEYPLLYLKDWHLRNAYPDDKFYKVPTYFSSDWLNEYLVESDKDDYRFVYMGPKGTWTPLHADVFKSYSWSVNLFGRKRWIFLFPGEEAFIRDEIGNFPADIQSVLRNSTLRYFEVVQETGDAIFVPSGWYHQVTNLEDTISINHNWVNGCNLKVFYTDMEKHLDEVKVEIADCQDDEEFEEQCQVVLNASYGMDYQGFLAFVTYIARKRMSTEKPVRNLFKFDLLRICEVLDLFLIFPDVYKLQLQGAATVLKNAIVNFLK